MTISVRLLANTLMALLVLFLLHRYLIFWQGWPDVPDSLSLVFGSGKNAENADRWQAFALIITYSITFVAILWHAFTRKTQSLLIESERYAAWSAYVIRFAFWSVLLIGVTDTFISSLKIENALMGIVGADLDKQLGQARFRAVYVHYPLLVVAAMIAAVTKGLSMIWLAFMVVIAEFMIVITRFIFSYEQAYMGDLVRFWYAALFLFASAYTLIEEGHVRVDVLYAGFRQRTKARVNVFGSLLLGIPLCFTILALGMESRQSSLSSPIINFEISQSAYGLFVKYLMAGFLIIFAVSMAMQFISYFLRNSANLLGDKNIPSLATEEH